MSEARHSSYFSFLESIPGNDVWILTETKFRKALLSAELKQNRLSRFKVETISDALFSLSISVAKSFGENSYWLPDSERVFFLQNIIESSPKAFPQLTLELSQTLRKARRKTAALMSFLERLLSFIDSVRLTQSDEALLRGAIDESGNTRNDKQYFEELVILHQTYLSSLDHGKLRDRIRTFELLRDYCWSERPKVAAAIGPQGLALAAMAIDQPSFLFPLQQELLVALGHIIPLHFCISPQALHSGDELTIALEKTSSRFIAPIGEFLKVNSKHFHSIFALQDRYPKRGTVAEYLFDVPAAGLNYLDSCESTVHELEIWNCGEIQDEVQRIAHFIETQVSAGLAKPSDYHILCFNLEQYYEILFKEFRTSGIPIAIPKGISLRLTLPGVLVERVLNWFERPSLFLAHAVFSSGLIKRSFPLVKLPNNSVTSLAHPSGESGSALWNRADELLAKVNIRDEDSPVTTEVELNFRLVVEFAEKWGISTTTLLNEELINSLLRLCIRQLEVIVQSSTETSTEKPLELANRQLVSEIAQLLLQLAALQIELKTVDEIKLIEHPDLLCKALWNWLKLRKAKSSRVRKNALRYISETDIARLNSESANSHQALYSEFKRTLQAWRSLRSIFIETKRTLEKHPTYLGGVLLKEGSDVFNMVSEYLTAQIRKQESFSEPDLTAVNVTEFLDARAIAGKNTIVLGLTSELFPFGNKKSALLGDKTDRFARRFINREENSSSYESYWLFAHVSRNSEKLIISFPKRNAEGELLTPSFVEELAGLQAHFRSAKLEKGSSLLEPNGTFPAKTKSINSSPHVNRATELLKARKSGRFSAFDGDLQIDCESILSESEIPRLKKACGKKVYSVSAFEKLADCPHRYFFSDLLGLSKIGESYLENVSALSGSIVHSALERFFSEHKNSELVYQDFSAACLKMNEIAECLFSASVVDWNFSTELRSAKLQVLQGLDTPELSKKRGILWGALNYQRQLLETVPFYVEYSFGKKGSAGPALSIINGATDKAAGDTKAEEILVSGIIDRIDINRESKRLAETEGVEVESIWDYKTGRATSLNDVKKGKSLQIPLYAAAVKQNISPHKLPKRGGIFSLAKPNRSGDEIHSVTKGVLIEHLALESSRSQELAGPEIVAGRVEEAKQRVVALHRLIKTGTFHQVLDTRYCPHCEFQQICGRDEAVLVQKLKFSSEDNQDCDGNLLKIKSDAALTLSDAFQDVKYSEVEDSNPTQLKKRSLSEEQLRACDISKNIVLSAGAGSGKTTVLVHRILKLLLQGVPSSSIVAITFTRKAAAEVKRRLEDLLLATLRQGEFENLELKAEQRRVLLEARVQIANGTIGTIHSFVSEILAADPALSGVGKETRVLSESARDDLIEEAISDVLSQTLRKDDSEESIKETGKLINEVLESGVSFQTLSLCVRRLVQNPNLLEQKDSPDVDAMLDIVSEIKNEMRCKLTTELHFVLGEWKNSCSSWLKSSQEQLKLSQEQITVFQTLISKVAQLEARLSVEGTNELLEETNAKVEELLSFISQNRNVAKRVSKYNPRNYLKELNDALSEIELNLLRVDLARERQSLTLGAQIVALGKISQKQFVKLKSEQEAVDFDDLISISEQILVSSKWDKFEKLRQQTLLTRLRQEISHLMVDEFQDTDSKQWEIVKALISPAENNPDRTLFLVGDLKQAIYGFRGGDIEVFEQASEQLVKHSGLALSLQENYRSHPEIIDFVNKFFKRLFAVDFDTAGNPLVFSATPYEELKPTRLAKSPQLETSSKSICLLMNNSSIVKDDKDTKADDELDELDEPERLACLLQNTLEDLAKNKQQARFGRLAQYQKGPLIAVLSRSSNELMKIAAALSSYSIAYHISHSRGFYDLDEILQFTNLLSVLDNSADTTALVGVLRSPLFGLSDLELIKLYKALNGNWQGLLYASCSKAVEEWDSSLAASIRATLNLWRQVTATAPVSQLLDFISQERNLCEVYQNAEYEDGYRNIERFIEKLRLAQLKGELTGDLAGTISWIKQQRRSDRGAPNANREDSPIVLSTIHGAKGLEYPMVVLPYLEWRQHRESQFSLGEIHSKKTKTRTKLLALPVEDEQSDFRQTATLVDHIVKQSANEAQACEERRLFYVACTRAREYLVLSLNQEKTADIEKRRLIKQDEAALAEKLRNSQSPGVWIRNIYPNGEF